MLVEVTHSIQPPKEMRFHGCSSACWLKVSNDSNCLGRNSPELDIESSSTIAVPILDNGELCSLGNGDGQYRQTPDKLIKRSTHAIKSIPASQRKPIGNIIQLNPEDMPLIFKIILSEKSAGVRLVEGFEVRVQSIQVLLCPIKLQIGVSQSGGDDSACWHT